MSKTLKELIAEDYKKCATDPIYFMKKYCKIQHPIKGKIPFHLYPFQEKTLLNFKDNRFNIVLKSRQTGISTLVAGFSLWKMLFNNDFNVLIIATKQEVAKNLVTKVRVMHDLLPTWLRGAAAEDNKLSLRLANGSQIKAIASSPDAGRSEALSLLVFDEAAFIDSAEEIWISAQSTLSTGGSCIALSTPNGVGNWFHKTWMDAENGINGFVTTRLHWSVHPERDKRWRDEQDRLLGFKAAAQECDTEFVSSGDNVIEPDVLMFYKDTYIEEPKEKRGIDNNLWIWEYPNTSGTYIVCADVARGDASDYSAAQVIDIVNLTQVAEYKGKMDTKDFGNFLVSLATEYNDALLVIENSNVGWATIQQCIDRNYGNLFYMSKDLRYVDTQRQLTNKINASERQLVAGFSTTSRTRPLIISKLDEYLTAKSITIRSSRLIDELFVFIWKNSKAQAMQGYNDDLIMAFSISLWIRDTAIRLRQEGINITQKSLENFSTMTTGMYVGKDDGQNPYKISVGDYEEDIRWLFK